MNVAGLFDRVHGDDVGVIERGDGFRLAGEPRPTFFALGKLGRENFDSDLPVELGVPRPEKPRPSPPEPIFFRIL